MARKLLPLVAALALVVSAWPQESAQTHFDGKTWWSYIKVLAADDMEGRESVRVDAEAPGRAQSRAAVDRARDAEIAQERVDRSGLDRARQPVGQVAAPSPRSALDCSGVDRLVRAPRSTGQGLTVVSILAGPRGDRSPGTA